MLILETDRLILREFSLNDAEFVLELLNEPSFLRYIGDKGVRNLDDARRYILDGPVQSYERNGFGLYKVELKDAGAPIGICGLVKREALPCPDLGFALLPAYWSKGYGVESAAAVLKYARQVLGLDGVVAITTPDNEASAKLLGKLGLKFTHMIKLLDDAAEVRLFTTDA